MNIFKSIICRTICLIIFSLVHSELSNGIDGTTNLDVLWPNAVVPYYIDSKHYNHNQIYFIMNSFAMFASKTCIKVVPLRIRPGRNDLALLLENPDAKRQCSINMEPFHSLGNVRRQTLGYDCLKTPNMEMVIMKILGVPLGGNLDYGDLYIMGNGYENINLYKLDHLDYKTINYVYNQECENRDYKNDLEYKVLCRKEHRARLKREIEPLDINNTEYTQLTTKVKEIEDAIKKIGFEKEFEEITHLVYKMIHKSFTNAKKKFCYKPILRTIEIELFSRPNTSENAPSLRYDEHQEDDGKAKSFMTELSLWKTSGLSMIGSMAQYVLKNVSVVVNLMNFENPDPQQLNEKHFDNVELTTWHF